MQNTILLFIGIFYQIILQCPNQALNIIQYPGQYEKLMTFTLNRSIEYILVFPRSTSHFPYRVQIWSSDVSYKFPILVVVRQEKEVLSWQVPFVMENYKESNNPIFLNTSRTLCHNSMEIIALTNQTDESETNQSEVFQRITIGLTTASIEPAKVFVQLSEEKQFYVIDDVDYSIDVSPSQTRYVYYKFAENQTGTIMIKITSEDNVCLTVSVQDIYCPVFDLEKDITYEGKYQTIQGKGGLTIRYKDFPKGFFLVFVVKSNNFACVHENSLLPISSRSSDVVIPINRTATVQFRIEKSINGRDYLAITVGTLSGEILFCIVSILVVFGFSRWGIVARRPSIKVDDELFDETKPVSRIDIEMCLSKNRVNLKNFALYPLKDKRRSFNYLWHIFSIAIFYSIPVVQLAITYQRIVNQTGNQDICYYNFLCAHPALGLSDYNHILSNIGYIFTGILLSVVVVYRQATIPLQFEKGIPVHYGLFYAMSIALIIEGILSACYHICPGQSNYQFDTSFMYVMAVLCMIKLYQNRHPDINATAYATFTVLGVTIFLAMVGILNGSLTVWIIFVVVYCFLCTYVSFKVYFFSYVLEGLNSLRNEIQNKGLTFEVFAPIRKIRFIILLIANIINYTMLITGLRFYHVGATDFGTFLLTLLMANAVLHAIFYLSMKLIYKERICPEAICYGILGLICWITATAFFLDYSTMWTMTPAESRQWNQDCILLNFYDKHDIWHLLSAPALYFSFMFLLCLDDDLLNVPQEQIRVF